MLAARSRLQILPISLKSADKTDPKPGGQIRIFPIGFMSPAPARITEDVDIGTPDSQALIDVPIAVSALPVILGPCFFSNGLTDLLLHFFVKHRSQTDSLGKNSCGACARNAVKRLVPPVVRRNAKPRDRRSIILQLTGLLLNCHLRYQFFRLEPCFFPVLHSVSSRYNLQVRFLCLAVYISVFLSVRH